MVTGDCRDKRANVHGSFQVLTLWGVWEEAWKTHFVGLGGPQRICFELEKNEAGKPP